LRQKKEYKAIRGETKENYLIAKSSFKETECPEEWNSQHSSCFEPILSRSFTRE
jgi:hypothetical protein